MSEEKNQNNLEEQQHIPSEPVENTQQEKSEKPVEVEKNEEQTVSKEETQPIAETVADTISQVSEPSAVIVSDSIQENEESPVEASIDWDTSQNEGFAPEYDEKERKEMEALYGASLNTINEKELIEGTVVGITNREVMMNIGFKSDGIISITEFRDTPDLKIGDKIEVYVEEQENAKGQLILSRRKAKIVKAWEVIQEALDQDKVITGLVKRRTKGGLIVDVMGVEAFLPGSQIDVKPIRDFDVFVGKEMEIKVVKINYTNDNVVVSHKVLIEKDLEEQKIEILNKLVVGQVLEGVIKNMTHFGVFIDLGGVDGLLHITDISYSRINHPEEVLSLDQKVQVVVLEFDDEKKRISLGMKQLQDPPWNSLDPDIKEGSKIKGKIVNVADYGAFIELKPGIEGLIHVSEMSWSQHLRNPSDFLKIGDEIEAVVLTLDREEHKMSCGIKQLSEDPWTKKDVLVKYAVGTQHEGIVRNLTNFGLFLELEEGIDGLVHVSDLSWTTKIKHPSEFVKVGENLEVIVMELDIENRRLALSHKHLEENPWDTFETVFQKGSVHKCTLIAKRDRGALLELPYGIEGHAHHDKLLKEDGSKAEEGEVLNFKVVDFSKDEKRILLSHTDTWKELKEKPTSKSGGKKGKKPSNFIDKEKEKSTLGDIGVLSELSEKMKSDALKSRKKAQSKKKDKPSDEEEE